MTYAIAEPQSASAGRGCCSCWRSRPAAGHDSGGQQPGEYLHRHPLVGIIDSLFTFARFEFLFKTVIVTFLLLLFGEILPKVAGADDSFAVRRSLRGPALVLRWIFYPLSYALVRTEQPHQRDGLRTISEISLDELADAIDMTQSSSPEEHVMLSGIVNFVNTEVQEIMKPRVDITAVAITAITMTGQAGPSSDRVSRASRSTRAMWTISRERSMSRICFAYRPGGEFGWQQLIRKPYFVPEHKKINDLLADFQRTRDPHGDRRR